MTSPHPGCNGTGHKPGCSHPESPKSEHPGGTAALDSSLERPIPMQTTFGTIEVRHGVLDDNAQRVLMTGHCVALATALSRRTGYPVVVDLGHEFWDDTSELREDVESGRDLPAGLTHAFLRGPDGTLYDAMGARTADEYIERMDTEYDEDAALYEIDADLAEAIAERYCPPPNWAWTDSIVEPLLERHGLPLE